MARELVSECGLHGFKGKAIDLENAKPEKMTVEHAAIFLVATYGEGDPTDNAVEFMDWLGSDLSADTLDGLKFTVFGLGNRQYEHYNKMGKDLNARLEALGGTRVYPHGEGDDDGNLEEDFADWKQDLWATLAKELDAHEDAGAAAVAAADADGLAPLPDAVWEVQYVQAPGTDPRPFAREAEVAAAEAAAVDPHSIPLSSRHYYDSHLLRVVEHREVRQQPARGSSTVHLELDLRGTGVTYQTADNLGVCPVNSAAMVEGLAAQMGWDVDAWIKLVPAQGQTARETTRLGTAPRNAGPDMSTDEPTPAPLFPTPVTVRAALEQYCDLTGPLKKSLVSHLAHFATNPAQRTRLAQLVAPANKAQWAEYLQDHRTIVQLLQDFDSVRPPLGRFLELVPRLAPRYYTICSSSKVQPERVAIAVSVLSTSRQDGSWWDGVSSTHLSACSLPVRDESGRRLDAVGPDGKRAGWPQVRAFVRASTFKLPAPEVPIIMVGPGTGIAPMRAFLQERAALREEGADVGSSMLFFGCRRESEDYLYKDELLGWARDGVLTAYHTAFSRHGQQKVYVQHKLLEQGQAVWDLLQQGAHVYVCGATRMGADVHRAFVDIAQKCGELRASDAEAYVKSLSGEGRYVQELWSA